MFKKLTPLNKEQHKNLKLVPPKQFRFIENSHVISIMAPEFVQASFEFPIVFIEGEGGEFKSTALLGLRPGVNQFVSSSGQLLSKYVPAMIRRYPFALAYLGQDADQLTLCIDEESNAIDEKDGEPIFDNSGEPTAILNNAKEFLINLRKMEVQTGEFCKLLTQNNLLTPLNLRIKEGEEVVALGGCYAINIERFNKIPDDIFLEFRKRGYIPVVYAHLNSLFQIQKMADSKIDKDI